MIGYRITESGSTAGVKTYVTGKSFVFISLHKERPVRGDKGIILADNIWSLTTAEQLDTATIIEISGRKYKVKSSAEGMAGMRKVFVEAQ
jgi:hypothetical protein